MATWDAAYVNDLDDSAFLYVESGGTKDDSGKTTPRSLRHFPVKSADGTVDMPHLRNALARIPQSNLPASVQDECRKKAEGMMPKEMAAADPEMFLLAGQAKGVELCRTGTFRDHMGRETVITEKSLDEMVSNFERDPDGPMILGHELKTDTPAVGWPARIYREGAKLLGDIGSIPARIAEAINDRQFRKVSLGIADNMPGRPGSSIHHIGLLGAQRPAVKGLADFPTVQLAAVGGGYTVFCFSEGDNTMTRAQAVESLKAAKVADILFAEAVPDVQVIALAEEIGKRAPKSAAAPAATPADQETVKVLAEHRAAAESATKALRDELSAQLVNTRHEHLSAVLAAAVKAGRVAPAEVDGIKAMAEASIASTEKLVLLAAATDKAAEVKTSSFDAIIKGIEARPVMKIFGEVSPEALKTAADGKKAKIELAAREEYHRILAETPGAFSGQSEEQWVKQSLAAEGVFEEVKK
jgi:hypothetical protein